MDTVYYIKWFFYGTSEENLMFYRTKEKRDAAYKTTKSKYSNARRFVYFDSDITGVGFQAKIDNRDVISGEHRMFDFIVTCGESTFLD